MNNLSIIKNVTINDINDTIYDLGKQSKTLCLQVYSYIVNHPDKDTRKELIESTDLSKQSISAMYKASELYLAYPMLEDMSHTKIVELAPLEKDGHNLPSATMDILGKDDVSEWEYYTQKEIRTLVKGYVNGGEVEELEEIDPSEIMDEPQEVDTEKISKDEVKAFFDDIVKFYEISKDDSNTLKYYLGI